MDYLLKASCEDYSSQHMKCPLQFMNMMFSTVIVPTKFVQKDWFQTRFNRDNWVTLSFATETSPIVLYVQVALKKKKKKKLLMN